jgi:hypothetical protein
MENGASSPRRWLQDIRARPQAKTAGAQSGLEVVREKARCLRLIAAGGWPD